MRGQLERDFERFKRELPPDPAAYIREAYRINLTARYLGYSLPHPIGKGSGQLSLNAEQIETDRAAGLAFVVLKTVIAEDPAGGRSMGAWAIHQTRMRVEPRVSSSGREGWTVTWKGRGWDRSFEEYLALVRFAADLTRAAGIVVVPSVKYHLPRLDEPFRSAEYRHTTEQLAAAWDGNELPLEKDFSPTLAGDALADERPRVLRWLREVPGQIRSGAGATNVRLAVKLMNARFDESFQVEMLEACGNADALVCFNRLWDPTLGAAYGGYDLSDRNLRVLRAARRRPRPPLVGTGNICSGRMLLEYARLGCESVELHTFFQLPLSQYPALAGTRTQRALHALLFHPQDGLVAGMLALEAERQLERRDGELHFLDVVPRPEPRMRISRIELYELTLPLLEPFIISGGTMTERRSLVVELHDDDGHVGFGESPPFELPFYSEETLAGARLLLTELLIPRLLGQEVAGPEVVDELLRAGVRGNPFARSALETAAWDLEAHRRGSGLAALLGERLGLTPALAIPCGVALGIPRDRSPRTLQRWIEAAIAKGYRRVKIKVAPGWDAIPVGAAREVLAGTGLPLTVDANGGYEWPEHEAALRSLDDHELLYVEQPLPPDDLIGHVRLSQTLRTPVCVDETLRDARAARYLLELNGPRIWNLKVHRVGGLSEVCRIVRVAAGQHAGLWAGTMPESGLGSQAALAAASLPGFVYPSDLEPSARWFGPGMDVIELTMSSEGWMQVPGSSIAGLLDRDRFQAASRRLLFLEAGRAR